MIECLEPDSKEKVLRKSTKCKYSERPTGMRYCNTHDCSGDWHTELLFFFWKNFPIWAWFFIAFHLSFLFPKKTQRRQRCTIREWKWYRMTIPTAATSFPTAVSCWRASYAATRTTMRIAVNHVDWLPTISINKREAPRIPSSFLFFIHPLCFCIRAVECV